MFLRFVKFDYIYVKNKRSLHVLVYNPLSETIFYNGILKARFGKLNLRACPKTVI